MADFKDWGDGWIKEGHFVSYVMEGIRYYEFVLDCDIAHYEMPWGITDTITETPTSIPAAGESGNPAGPHTPDVIEVTRGYNKLTNLNHIWQMIFGIKGQVLVYIELPTDTHRHGIPKLPKPSAEARRVSHFEEYMSPYREPSFLTQHYLMRPMVAQISFEAYNPNAIAMTDVWLNLFINKMVTERIGTETNGVGVPSRTRFREVLDKLMARQVPHRPITLLPVTAPAEAPAGE